MGLLSCFCASDRKAAIAAPSTSLSEDPPPLPETAALSQDDVALRDGPSPLAAVVAGIAAVEASLRQPYTPPIRPPPQHSQSDLQPQQEEAGFHRPRPASGDVREPASGELNLQERLSSLRLSSFLESPPHALDACSGRDSLSHRGLPAGPALASPSGPHPRSTEHFFLHETQSLRGSTGGPLSVDIISKALRTAYGNPGGDSPSGGGIGGSGALSPRGGGASVQAEALMRDLTSMRVLGRGGCGTVYLVGEMGLPACFLQWTGPWANKPRARMKGEWDYCNLCCY